jgi:hypothetical protein
MARRWFGRDETIAWPPSSPDLTPLIFSSEVMRRTLVTDLENLKARMKDAVARVKLNMLQATWDEAEYHLDICRATKGAHIEIY